MPGLSIITICKQNDCELIKTFKSMNKLPEMFLNKMDFEYIIVTSAELNPLKNLAYKILSQNCFFKVKVLKDKGDGIYQAMNIGLKHSQYQFVYFLNSGDQIYNKILWKKIYKIINSDFFENSRSSISFQTYQQYLDDIFLRGGRLYQLTNKSLIAHQGIIMNKLSFKNMFFEEDNVKYWADRLFIQRNIDTILPLQEVGAVFQLGGISNSMSTPLKNRPKDKIINHIIKIVISRILTKKYYYRCIYLFKYKRLNAKSIDLDNQ